jgi:predicted nucleic acid-binding Zn ribbon protein
MRSSKCTVCGMEMSDGATHCPACGAKMRKLVSPLPIMIAGLVLAGVIMAVFGR